MQLAYPIRTARLVIRPLTTSDLARHFEIYSNPDVVRFLYEEPFDLEGARSHLARRCKVDLPSIEGEWLNLGVEVDGEGVLVGELGVALVSDVHRQCEVGYVMDPGYAGRGYATEAAAMMVELAFSSLGAHRVSARLDERNRASSRLLERLGMRREGLFVENEFVKGEWTDEAVFAILETEWRAMRGPAPSILYRT